MPIAIALNPLTGEPFCHCCRDNLYHCKNCWSKFHNSHQGKDFIEPEYFGKPFISQNVIDECDEELSQMALKLGKEYIKREIKFKPNKERKYKEGDYGHPK